MYQSYNSYYQQQAMRPTALNQNVSSQFGLKGRPVSSLEEARAMSIDFDGSIFYFPDLANRRIYTKQVNMDGTATLNMYELKDFPTISPNSANYVTREEFEAALNKIQSSINSMAPTPVPVPPQPAEASISEPVPETSSKKTTQEAPNYLF